MIEVIEICRVTGQRRIQYVNPDRILLIEEVDKDLYFSRCNKETRPVSSEIISRISFGVADGHMFVCHGPATVAMAIIQSKARVAVVPASDE